MRFHLPVPYTEMIQLHGYWIQEQLIQLHVASSLKFYTKYKEINPIVVRLPTGQQVLATHLGTVNFTEFLHLEDVLYLPSFNFNLISISKSVSSLNCQLTFSANKCLIQDVTSLRMIGIVDVVGGLYKMLMPSASSGVSSVVGSVKAFPNQVFSNCLFL